MPLLYYRSYLCRYIEHSKGITNFQASLWVGFLLNMLSMVTILLCSQDNYCENASDRPGYVFIALHCIKNMRYSMHSLKSSYFREVSKFSLWLLTNDLCATTFLESWS